MLLECMPYAAAASPENSTKHHALPAHKSWAHSQYSIVKMHSDMNQGCI